MKKLIYTILVIFVIGAMLQGCSSKNEIVDNSSTSGISETNNAETNTSETNISEDRITKEMAYEGINNYCHSEFDWSVAEGNPESMYVAMDEESETEYQVIFHSYTGAIVYFYVDKSSGTTRMVEYVPILDLEEEAGTINLYDYLNKNDEVDNQEKGQNEGYEIILSENDITIEKGSEASFDITFTNPDESSIREYITCEDQDDIILVKYSMLENKKITVEVEALKVGTTEILVCDYNYPDRKEIVRVNVVEEN